MVSSAPKIASAYSCWTAGRVVAIAFACVWASLAGAAPGEVTGAVEIHTGAGGFVGPAGNADFFGTALASLGDLDGDGVEELAVGAPGADDGGPGRGAVWVLFMNPDGTVKAEQKISATHGGFAGALDDNDQFGQALAGLGDVDGDGVSDLAVSAHLDDDGGTERGAVWMLFLNSNGTVKAHQKISSTQGGFAGVLADADAFGIALATLDDLDGNGTNELAVGAHRDDDGGAERGAVWVLYLVANGTVVAEQKISALQGSFVGPLDDGDLFGISVAGIGDLDANGLGDLAVGAHQDDDGGPERGALWLLSLDANANVLVERKVSDTQGGFAGVLDDGDLFGRALAAVGDVNGDGHGDLAVGANQDDDGGSARGAVWILFLDGTGNVIGEQKISELEGGFAGPLANGDRFGSAVAATQDLDGDTRPELVVGSIFDAGGGVLQGASWVLFLDVAIAEVPSFSAFGIATLCGLIVVTGIRRGGPARHRD